MKKIIKNAIIFASVIVLSLLTSVIFLGSRVKAADLGNGSFSVEYTTAQMENYYGKEAPAYDTGYFFAGWYEDETCTVSYVKETATETLDKYYAKFVPQAVLTVKAQHELALHNVVLNDESKGLIRFTTSTDSNNYQEIGLHVEGTIGSHTLNKDYPVGTIYTYLYAAGDTTNDKNNPVAASTVFETDSAKYFAPYSFKIKLSQFGDDFTITPYWITPDGVRVDGVARTRNMIENLEDNSCAEVNGLAYYTSAYTSDNLSTLYNTYVGEETSFEGTAASPIKITVMKNMIVTEAVSISGKYVIIQNDEGADVTISRGNDDEGNIFTGNMFGVNSEAFLQLGRDADSQTAGNLYVDGGNTEISGRTIYISQATSNFVLQKNAVLQNAVSTAQGSVIVNKGKCELYGTIQNNVSSNITVAGAILQCRGSKELIIYEGSYTGNTNTETNADIGGGFIVAQNATSGTVGDIVIKGGTFENNSANHGGVIETGTGSATYGGTNITIEDGRFKNNSAENGGIAYLNSYGSLTITGGTFESNTATANGGVIATAAGTTTTDAPNVTISGGTFSKNSAAAYGGVVCLDKFTTLEVESGIFNENSTTNETSYGGVIATLTGTEDEVGADITISGGEFTSNSSTYGGVAFIQKYVTITVNDGNFSSNSAKNGGVIVTSTGTSATLCGTVTINDGEFSSNTASQSGGVVHMGAYGVLTINDGNFAGNSNTSTDSKYGGGVIAVAPSTTTNINGGIFSSNTATYGGVIFTPSGNSSSSTSGADVTIANGTFTNNSAKMGGVVYLNYSGSLIATGGTFNQNAATTYGGGVLYVLNAEATLSNVTMTGNCTSAAKAAYYGGGAITLYRDATVTISNCSIYGNTHTGALTDSEKNTDGCDIAFGGGNTAARIQKLVVLDDSFNGIIGHVSSTALATHQVQFGDGTVKQLEKYNTRYIINYDEQTLEEVSAHSIILVSDMHYTTNYTQTEYNLRYLFNGANASAVSGPMFGYTQDERMEIILSDINDYAAEKGFLDAVLFLGDLSIDNKGYANLHEDFLKTFKDNYLSGLSYPWYAIAGNHDSYTADEWETYMGMKRQYSVEIDNAVFIMLDTFEAAHATTASGSNYVGVDTEFLAAELAKEEYADKIIFLCSHYYAEGKDTTNDAAFQAILEAEKAGKNRIVCMFRGHSHNSRIITNQTSMAGIPLVDIGGYAYNPDGVDGDYNVFQETYAWGYQVLEWDESEVRLYHVKPARTYTDSSTTYAYAGYTTEITTITR